MNPRTERFEMRLEPELIERIDAWRATQDDSPSRAETIRRLVEDGLSRSSSDLNPSQQERLMLWMLSEIMRKQGGSEHEKDSVELIQQALYSGSFWALNWEMTGVLHNHVDRNEDVTFVVDVLDMWSFIEEAYEELSTEDKSALASQADLHGEPRFPGFDGNHERELLGIARMMTGHMGRFERFKGHHFNSHHPTRARYRNMLRAFETIRPTLIRRRMNLAELVRVLNI